MTGKVEERCVTNIDDSRFIGGALNVHLDSIVTRHFEHNLGHQRARVALGEALRHVAHDHFVAGDVRSPVHLGR